MKKVLIHTLISGLLSLFMIARSSGGQSRYLILDFDCRGDAAGQAGKIGNALRNSVAKQGGQLISRDLFEKTLRQKKINESDLNYTIDDLRSILNSVGADGAAFGVIYTYEDLFTIEMKYIEPGDDQPILFDPIVCGSLDDIFAMIPSITSIILSPDKIPPVVLSIDPSDGRLDVEQFVDLKIVFSEPMNPSTISISALPEDMWTRYGDIDYDPNSNSFNLKLHLYPDIEYEFQINGDNSKGFKDLAGNPAKKYTWKIKTSR